MADIEFEIDGQTLTAKPGQTIIEVADAAGIYIPRFCYHKHLSVSANCRMCLVEVEKSPKTLPACATPVTGGMKVFTKSEKTIASQRAVMEFLLINHPLDCPICDQGGECELQDIAIGYGASHSHYDECKRAVADEDLGPLIATDMTRCILCTRCVRYGQEVVGLRELGVVERGGHAEVKTYIKHAMTSEVSANIIDICPVGALTSKPYRFKARSWELMQAPGIAPHDCLGSNINVHTYNGKVLRVVARENLAINDAWLSDRDRFACEGLYHQDRYEEPAAKIDGKWMPVSWQEAFEMAAEGLQKSIAQHGVDKFGALASPSATLEEFYLLQKLTRSLGSSHVDYRLREMDTRDQADMGAFPGMSLSLPEIESCDAILLLGSNLQKEQPIAALRVRQAVKNQAVVAAVNPVDYDFNFSVTAKNIISPDKMPAVLAKIANALGAEIAGAEPDEAAQTMAAVLKGKEKVCIILGALAMHASDASGIRYLAQQIAKHCNAKLCLMTDGANAAGAWLAGAVPHRQAGGIAMNHQGLSAHEMFEKARKSYLLLNVEPGFDCANPGRAAEAIKQADFTVAVSLYRSDVLEAHADLILPMAAFTETSGTFVNAWGEWQSFKGVAKPFKATRPAWKILRALAGFLQLDGFEYESSEEVKKEVKSTLEKMPEMRMQLKQPAAFNLSKQHSALTRIGEIPIYATDSIVRRSAPLQAAQAIMLGDVAAVRIHPETAKKLNVVNGGQVQVKQSGHEAELTVLFDEQIAKDAVWLAGSIPAAMTLGNLFGEIEVRPC